MDKGQKETPVDRLELVEIIEREKARLSPKGRELWDEMEISVYMSPEEESKLNPHEQTTIENMAYLPQSDQDVLNRLMELRAGLYDSDAVERRGESGESRRAQSVILAANLKNLAEGKQADPFLSLEQARARLREDT
jgi:hypothetical protein